MEYQAAKEKFNLQWSAITDCFLAFELYFQNSFVEEKVEKTESYRVEYPRALIVWKGDAPSMMALRFFSVLRLYLPEDCHVTHQFREFGESKGADLQNAYRDLNKLILSLNFEDQKDPPDQKKPVPLRILPKETVGMCISSMNRSSELLTCRELQKLCRLSFLKYCCSHTIYVE
jgi:hypothetical protein